MKHWFDSLLFVALIIATTFVGTSSHELVQQLEEESCFLLSVSYDIEFQKPHPFFPIKDSSNEELKEEIDEKNKEVPERNSNLKPSIFSVSNSFLYHFPKTIGKKCISQPLYLLFEDFLL